VREKAWRDKENYGPAGGGEKRNEQQAWTRCLGLALVAGAWTASKHASTGSSNGYDDTAATATRTRTGSSSWGHTTHKTRRLNTTASSPGGGGQNDAGAGTFSKHKQFAAVTAAPPSSPHDKQVLLYMCLWVCMRRACGIVKARRENIT